MTQYKQYCLNTAISDILVIFRAMFSCMTLQIFESFGTMDKLKKDIDKNKEKKDVRFLQTHILHFRS